MAGHRSRRSTLARAAIGSQAGDWRVTYTEDGGFSRVLYTADGGFWRDAGIGSSSFAGRESFLK